MHWFHAVTVVVYVYNYLRLPEYNHGVNEQEKVLVLFVHTIIKISIF